MNRQIVQLHTIDQWMQLDPTIRVVILKNIKLKDRLYKYLYSLNNKESKYTQPTWVLCSKCAESQYPGHVLMEPRYDGLHPSQIGHPCLLKIYNEIVGVPSQEKVEARLRLIFDLGHAVHHMFQTYGLNGAWGSMYKHEVEISERFQPLAAALMIEGHADADNILVIDDIPNAPIYELGLVHEYKSANENNFKKLTGPKPEHRQQAMLYAAALNRPVVVYLYLNKNDSNLSDFPVQFEPARWANLEAKAQTIKGYYDRQEPPPAEVGFHCKDCGFSFNCAAYKQTQSAARR